MTHIENLKASSISKVTNIHLTSRHWAAIKKSAVLWFQILSWDVKFEVFNTYLSNLNFTLGNVKPSQSIFSTSGCKSAGWTFDTCRIEIWTRVGGTSRQNRRQLDRNWCKSLPGWWRRWSSRAARLRWGRSNGPPLRTRWSRQTGLSGSSTTSLSSESPLKCYSMSTIFSKPRTFPR